jgi:threonylcarbamoyladenosine tRNA methylthiotransferase MtaB
MDRPIDYKIHTYGCKVNTYDSGLLEQRLSGAGFALGGEPQVHVLNTCAVTAEATKEAVRAIRKIKSKNPFAKVVVTGCAAQVDKESFEPLPGADLIIANSHKGQLQDLIKKHLRGELTERVFHSNIFKKEDLEAGGGVESSHTRAFLKIQDGCNSFCTYCVIPFARGKSRSLSIPYLVERVNQLYENGSREVVLTGVHIGDYEDVDTMGVKQPLEELIESVLSFTKMPRIRLTSFEPVEISERLLDLYSNRRLCPHFHMSIQSANTKVLRDMKRKYSAEDVEVALNRIAQRVDYAFVGMDVITGFPGETDEEFQDTYDRLARLPWTRIHVFPYSPRPGTKAAQRLDHLERSKIVARADRLRELSAERFSKTAIEQIGKMKEVLVLKKENQSLSRDYWPVQIPVSAGKSGEEVSVKIVGFDQSARAEGSLVGELI